MTFHYLGRLESLKFQAAPQPFTYSEKVCCTDECINHANTPPVNVALKPHFSKLLMVILVVVLTVILLVQSKLRLLPVPAPSLFYSTDVSHYECRAQFVIMLAASPSLALSGCELHLGKPIHNHIYYCCAVS